MNVLLFLIPISIVLLLIGIAAFFWAVHRDQFENLDAAALDVLADDSRPEPDKKPDAG
jgi:cbb3-type cytochrome oxidase maturation protein